MSQKTRISHKDQFKVLFHRTRKDLTRRNLFVLGGLFIVSLFIISYTDMIWQQYIFSFGAFILTLILLPSIVKDSVVPRWTSIPASFVVLGFTIAFFSRGLYFAALGNGINCIAWSILAIYRGPSVKEEEVEKLNSI